MTVITDVRVLEKQVLRIEESLRKAVAMRAALRGSMKGDQTKRWLKLTDETIEALERSLAAMRDQLRRWRRDSAGRA